MARIAMDRRGRVRWWLQEGSEAAPGLLEELLEDPEAVLSSPRSVARERQGRKRLYHLRREPEERGLFVKVFTLPGARARLRYLLRPSKARREAAAARALVRLGFEVAAPVAVGEERAGGLLRRSYAVIPERGERDLRAVLADPATGRARRRALLQEFALFARRLHDAGVDQDDFSPNNFLVGPQGRFVLIDFERCRIGRPLGRRRWTLLAKLHRQDLGVSRADRLRFLGAYLGPEAGRDERRWAWGRIHQEFRRIRGRDARHAARGAFQVGRHLARDGETWVVRGRERRPVIRLPLRPEEARAVWVLCRQLERLKLPALRPVRLRPDSIELEDPGPCPDPPDRDALVAAARRKLEPWGRFVSQAEWSFTAEGAKLRDPRAFRLDPRKRRTRT